MPSYLTSNPNTVILGKNNQGVLARDVDFNASQVIAKTMVKINANQRFGYSKDTPFTNSFVQHNQNTKAIFTQPARNLKSAGNLKNAADPGKSRQLVGSNVKIFTKISDASHTVESQKKVQLLYNKEAYMNLQRAAEESYLEKL